MEGTLPTERRIPPILAIRQAFQCGETLRPHGVTCAHRGFMSGFHVHSSQAPTRMHAQSCDSAVTAATGMCMLSGRPATWCARSSLACGPSAHARPLRSSSDLGHGKGHHLSSLRCRTVAQPKTCFEKRREHLRNECGSRSWLHTDQYDFIPRCGVLSRSAAPPDIKRDQCLIVDRASDRKSTGRLISDHRDLQAHAACAHVRRRLENMRSLLHDRSSCLLN